MDWEKNWLRYDETLPGTGRKSQYKVFRVEVQGFIYHAYRETEDTVEVLERLQVWLGKTSSAYSVGMVEAAFRHIEMAIINMASKPPNQQEHWNNVLFNYALSADQFAVGVEALLKRVGHGYGYGGVGTSFIIRCYDMTAGRRPYVSFNPRNFMKFGIEEVSFFYNAMNFENLSAKDTTSAYTSWKNEYGGILGKRHIRGTIRYLHYLRTISLPGSAEADDCNLIIQRREDLLIEIRRHAPTKDVVQEAPERAEAQNLYQGQSSSTGFSALTMPPTSYTNDPQIPAPSQQHYQTDLDLQWPQPATQPTQSRTLGRDPKPPQTTVLSQKRPATHTPDNGSSDSKSSSPSSNSSNDNHRRDDERNRSSEEWEATRQAELKSIDDDHEHISWTAWEAGHAKGGTPEARKAYDSVQPTLNEIRGMREETLDIKDDIRNKKKLEQKKPSQESSGRGGQREHHGT